MGKVKFLGIYLVMISCLQIKIYLAMTFLSGDYLGLFYFDPRIGNYFFETVIRGAERNPPGIVGWLSAVWVWGLDC